MSVASDTDISVCTEPAAPFVKWEGVNPLESLVEFPWHERCSK